MSMDGAQRSGESGYTLRNFAVVWRKVVMTWLARLMVAVGSCVLLPGYAQVAAKAPTESPLPSSETSRPGARIRLASWYQANVYPALIPGESCVPHTDSKNWLEGLGPPGPFTDVAKRTVGKSIGIPKTDMAPHVLFIEREVETNNPITVQMRYSVMSGSSTQSCTVGTSLVPENGADYEVRFVPTEKGCKISLHRIALDGEQRVVLKPVSTAKNAPRCKNIWGQDMKG